MALSDRIVVMERGQVSQIGSPRELYDQPATRFTASFIGSSNRRVTTVEFVDGDPVIPWGSARLPVALNGVRAGSSVLAVWRPEAAAVIDPALAPAGALRGQVELVTFLGPITRLDVRIGDDTDLVLVDLVSGTARNIVAGQKVALSVPPDAIRLYT